MLEDPVDLVGVAICLGISSWLSFNAMFRDRIGFARTVGYLFDAKNREMLRERKDIKIGGLLRLASWIALTCFGAVAGWLILRETLGFLTIFLPT